MHFVLVTVYGMTVLPLTLGLLFALGARSRRRRCLGPLLHGKPAGRALRAVTIVALVAVLALVLGAGESSRFWPLTAVALALLVSLLRPSAGDALCGGEGVARGWDSARFEELAEWRLTGDHLRFPLHGLWAAVELPRALQDDVRARLESSVPDRESRFKA